MKSITVQILIAVAIGILAGLFLPESIVPIFGEIGKIIIHWLKLIAGPILFLTIFVSILQVEMKWSHGFQLIFISILNTSIAILIGLTLTHLFLKNGIMLSLTESQASIPTPNLSLGLETFAKTFMPSSLFSPIVNNEILLLAMSALILGITVRQTTSIQNHQIEKLISFLDTIKDVLLVFLKWLIKLIPFAVLAIVTAAVSKYGVHIFQQLSKFVGTVLFAFILHTIIVYGTWIIIVSKVSFKRFWKSAKTPVSYAFGVNSSLATLPLTLKALKELKVSDRSASLGAGVATNLNNDGIVLYEAIAVFFIASYFGVDMSINQMVLAALTCIVASMGITGIPEAGFISLTVVIGALNLPAEALPLLLSVDWALARFRSVVNVLSDMTLSIAMDKMDR